MVEYSSCHSLVKYFVIILKVVDILIIFHNLNEY